LEASIVTWAPIFLASSSLKARTSVANTMRAPTARATATAQQPMGPEPTTATLRPATSPESVVWTALPKGSWIAATSGEIPGSMA
jgi:hypothetical protein